jgi:hypothetical protein
MKATITILGKKYTGEGVTAKEALANLNYIGFARLKSIITMDYGDKEKILVLYPRQTMLLFSKSPMQREIGIKSLSLRF